MTIGLWSKSCPVKAAFRCGLIAVLLAIAALMFLAAAPSARGQVPPLLYTNVFQPNVYYNVMTNGPVTLTNGQLLAITTQPISVRKGIGLGFLSSLIGTNATSANVTYGWQVTVDGTTYTTTTPFAFAFPLAGTTNVVGFTNFAAWGTGPTLDNFRYIQLATLLNGHTNSITVSNCFVSRMQ